MSANLMCRGSLIYSPAFSCTVDFSSCPKTTVTSHLASLVDMILHSQD